MELGGVPRAASTRTPSATFEAFEAILGELYAAYTFERAERESGVPAATLREVAELVASAGTRLSTHTWRTAAAGNLGGWQVSRTLFLLNALLGAVGDRGRHVPERLEQVRAPADPLARPSRSAGTS